MYLVLVFHRIRQKKVSYHSSKPFLILGGRQNVPESVNSGGTNEPNEPRRHIIINDDQSLKYCSNKVSTAKYNVFSFVPIFLFEQFRKYSNIFFLFIALLQVIIMITMPGKNCLELIS